MLIRNQILNLSTRNLANGVVTNPKLGPLSVSSPNIGTGQVTTQKIAPGAIYLTTTAAQAVGSASPGHASDFVTATCPSGTVVTGGGYQFSPIDAGAIPWESEASVNGWTVLVFNPSSSVTVSLTVNAVCATIHP